MASGSKPPSRKDPASPWTAPQEASGKAARPAKRPPLHDGPRHAVADTLTLKPAKTKKSAKVAPLSPSRVAAPKTAAGQRAARPAAPHTAAESYAVFKETAASLKQLMSMTDKIRSKLENATDVADYAEQYAQRAAHEEKCCLASLQMFEACLALVTATPDKKYTSRVVKSVEYTQETLRKHLAVTASRIAGLTKHVERPEKHSSDTAVQNLYTKSKLSMPSTPRQTVAVRDSYAKRLKALTKQHDFLNRALRRTAKMAEGPKSPEA